MTFDATEYAKVIEGRKVGSIKKHKERQSRGRIITGAVEDGSTGGDISLNGRLVMSGSAFAADADGKAVAGVRRELAGYLRGRSQVRPEDNKRLDELVRDPSTGRLIHTSELPTE